MYPADSPGGTIYYSPASAARGSDTLTLWPVAPALNNVQPTSVDVNWSPPDWQSASPIHDYDMEVLADGFWAN